MHIGYIAMFWVQNVLRSGLVYMCSVTVAIHRRDPQIIDSSLPLPLLQNDSAPQFSVGSRKTRQNRRTLEPVGPLGDHCVSRVSNIPRSYPGKTHWIKRWTRESQQYVSPWIWPAPTSTNSLQTALKELLNKLWFQRDNFFAECKITVPWHAFIDTQVQDTNTKWQLVPLNKHSIDISSIVHSIDVSSTGLATDQYNQWSYTQWQVAVCLVLSN